MIFCAKYLYLLTIVIGIWFMVKNFNKRIFIFSLIYLPLTFIIAKVLGLFFYNPRPFAANHFTPLIIHAANNGFPSEHSLVSFAVASIIFVFNRKLGFVLFASAFLVGISRVYTGVHYPLDILGSFVITIVTAAICAKIISWKK